MSNYYNYDGIKTELEKRRDEAAAKLASWEKVTFPTKKDGSAFKVLSKNIDGAKLSTDPYAMQAGENVLSVYTHCNARGYIHDELQAYELVRYMKDPEKLAKTENYQPKMTYLEQVYTYDLDDIKKAVASRIEYLKGYVSDLDCQIEKSLDVFQQFRDAYAAAMKSLDSAASAFKHSDILHLVRDTVKERYPYC